ncbi:hypothetical protein GCM10010390_40030 [Streptomyces mordarskii]|uniref:Uncharacterized protein n=1 Tax=Streptomyces mordarskii TaxID=1226758 RepID=A0ABN1D4P8_9ACTN
MSTPSAIRRELARIAQGGEDVGALGGGVLAVSEEQLRGDIGAQSGVGLVEQAQRVGQFAGEAARVGDEVEVDQHPVQAVLGHRTQDG